ncbi:hypothetical protein L195_g036582, partial [Trifolium pratense]
MLAPDGSSFFQELNITDDHDVKYMFNIHSQFQLKTIELYVTFQNVHSYNPHQTSTYIEPHQTPQLTSQPYHIDYQPTSTDYAPLTHSHEWVPFDQQQNSFHYSQLTQSFDLNAPFDLNEEIPQSEPWSYSNPTLSQLQPWWSSNTQLPHSQPQQAYPSTSTHVPTHHDDGDDDDDDDNDSRPDEVPNYPEDLADLSDEEALETQLLDHGNDDNGDDDDNERNQDGAYNPPSHIQNLDLTLIDQPSRVYLHENVPLPVNAGITKGMTFYTKKECLAAIKSWHVKQSRDYHIEKSDTTRFVIKCDKPPCQFALRAAYSKKTELWGIATISNSHTCVSVGMSQDHRRLDTAMVCDNIVPLLKNNLGVTVKFIIDHIRAKFNYTISYRKAWSAKNKAIEHIYGSWVQSYRDLPRWLMAMEKWVSGTVIRFETSPTAIHGEVHFERLFWAFKPCIEGFAHCKPIVQVDGTFLTGKYKGTLLLAVAQDGNAHIFPVAYAIVEGETKDAWNFFLKHLRENVTPQENICLISDRHASIKSAFENPSNGWNHSSSHVYCIRHIAQNFMRAIKNRKLRKYAVNM